MAVALNLLMYHLGACQNADAQLLPSQSLIQWVELGSRDPSVAGFGAVVQVVIRPHFGTHQASQLSGDEWWVWV